jgi:hypothetical protein
MSTVAKVTLAAALGAPLALLEHLLIEHWWVRPVVGTPPGPAVTAPVYSR